jgi:deazaflavin-dependent oxidoreductase (nitroreductase family)
MAGAPTDEAKAFNKRIIERLTPLGCFPLGDDRYLIVASSGGSPTHPDWYHNLKAHPRIDVEVGTRAFTVLAEELDDRARAELWPKLVAGCGAGMSLGMVNVLRAGTDG